MLLLLLAAVRLGGTEITEASGLVASATQRGILWANNDSGDGPYLYAFDAGGKPRATVLVPNATARDWEDLASGPFMGKRGTWLYAADIGDNRSVRTDACVYAIPEPKIGPSSRVKPLTSAPAIPLPIRYPDGPHNAECLLCDPRDGRLTIVTKEPNGISGVYRFPKTFAPVNLLEKVGELRVPGASPLVTGGSFRPDGKAVALVTYSHVVELAGKEFWKAVPRIRPQPDLNQLESVAYARDGKSLWLTSEGNNPPLVNLPLPLSDR